MQFRAKKLIEAMSRRSAVLYGCACVRSSLWPLLSDQEKLLVDAVERSDTALLIRIADSHFTPHHVSLTNDGYSLLWSVVLRLVPGSKSDGVVRRNIHNLLLHCAWLPLVPVARYSWYARVVFDFGMVDLRFPTNRQLFGEDFAPRYEELIELAQREFLPLSRVYPSVLAREAGNVPRLARAIETERRFSDLPILADAMEEAGCEDAELLSHCRQEGREHYLGCRALEAILR